MALTTFSLPAVMNFNIGSTEQKMDMRHENSGKTAKKVKKQRVPIKSRYRKLNDQDAKVALQKSVVSRSSALRQGKYAEARARSGGCSFVSAKAAAKKALTTPVTSRTTMWIKNRVKPELTQKSAHFTASILGNMEKSDTGPSYIWQSGNNQSHK